jgi:predicted SpoU family rRNA methylase
MNLIEIIDLINKECKSCKKFFGFDGFEKLDSLIFNYCTFDFDLIQKKDSEIKENFRKFLKENNYYKFVEKSFDNSQINILPSNVAESVICEYKENLGKTISEVNSKLMEAYKSRGFGNF